MLRPMNPQSVIRWTIINSILFSNEKARSEREEKTFTFLFFDKRGARDNETLVTRIWPQWLDCGAFKNGHVMMRQMSDLNWLQSRRSLLAAGEASSEVGSLIKRQSTVIIKRNSLSRLPREAGVFIREDAGKHIVNIYLWNYQPRSID